VNATSSDSKQQVAPEFQLLDAPRLLEALFPDKACRPSIRWLRYQQKARLIPFCKLGRFVFFNLADAREAIASRHTVNARGAK
jgi:hypothetical protein